MNDSKLLTMNVPNISVMSVLGNVGGTSGTPVPCLVHQASNAGPPQRVVVRNVSVGVSVFLALAANPLQENPAGSTSYELPAGDADIFVLAPGQKLYAIAGGVDGKICVAVSDALPVDGKV
jgi:hypothetical protein